MKNFGRYLTWSRRRYYSRGHVRADQSVGGGHRAACLLSAERSSVKVENVGKVRACLEPISKKCEYQHMWDTRMAIK